MDDQQKIETTLVNQITLERSVQKIAKFQAGPLTLNNDAEIVDQIQEITGATATIFQLVDDKLLRISTNVRKTSGERATGTYIPSSSPVYQAIMKGMVFRGKAFVVNDWYLTAYKPLKNADDEIVGAIYVGQLMLSSQVRTLVSETKMGPGYFFVYTDAGSVLIHPTLKPTDNLLEKIPAFKEPDGLVEYIWDGTPKLTYKKRIESWGVNTGCRAEPCRYCRGAGHQDDAQQPPCWGTCNRRRYWGNDISCQINQQTAQGACR